MNITSELKQKVLKGEKITKQQALDLFSQPLAELCSDANAIRVHFCKNAFDICTIINAKSGRCSEDCKFCSQSGHYETNVNDYPLLSEDEIIKQAKYNYEKGVLRYSTVTSGKSLNDKEVQSMCEIISNTKAAVNIRLCASFGLLSYEQCVKLKQAGLERVHNNLETSQSNFQNICTTHSFTDKLNSINAAKSAGLQVCSGGIFGIGESNQDRVDLAFSLSELNIKSVPINLLNPAKGTPFESFTPLSNEELCKIVAVFRFVLPDACIRLAGGRGLLADKGRGAFLSGANAAITGDMLTTSGISIDTDLQMLKELGFMVKAYE